MPVAPVQHGPKRSGDARERDGAKQNRVRTAERPRKQSKERFFIMWIADNWKDYEVIDCSQGEKLERWGKYLSLIHI